MIDQKTPDRPGQVAAQQPGTLGRDRPPARVGVGDFERGGQPDAGDRIVEETIRLLDTL